MCGFKSAYPSSSVLELDQPHPASAGSVPSSTLPVSPRAVWATSSAAARTAATVALRGPAAGGAGACGGARDKQRLPSLSAAHRRHSHPFALARSLWQPQEPDADSARALMRSRSPRAQSRSWCHRWARERGSCGSGLLPSSLCRLQALAERSGGHHVQRSAPRPTRPTLTHG